MYSSRKTEPAPLFTKLVACLSCKLILFVFREETNFKFVMLNKIFTRLIIPLPCFFLRQKKKKKCSSSVERSLLLSTSSRYVWGFPGGSDAKASACNAGDLDSIPRLGRSPGERNGNPFQYSCLENPMDGGAWQATVHGVAKSQTRLSD